MADALTSSFPTSVEPVKVILRTLGSSRSGAAKEPGLEEVTRLHSPSGTSARSMAWKRATADSGVCSAGLTTIVQPAAIAGASLRTIMASGKFHGVTAPATPRGFCWTMSRFPGT